LFLLVENYNLDRSCSASVEQGIFGPFAAFFGYQVVDVVLMNATSRLPVVVVVEAVFATPTVGRSLLAATRLVFLGRQKLGAPICRRLQTAVQHPAQRTNNGRFEFMRHLGRKHISKDCQTSCCQKGQSSSS
jgi:hypothetical protein